MSTIKVTNIQNPSSGTDDIQIDASGNVNIDSNTLYVDATNNRVGVGTTSPASNFDLQGSNTRLRIDANTSSTDVEILARDTGNSVLKDLSLYALAHKFLGAGVEFARIDSSGRLLVGTSSNDSNAIGVFSGYVGGTNSSGALAIRYGATRPTTSDQLIGVLRFESASATASSYHYASIECRSDGASSSDTDIPGRLVFSTTADGSSSPTTRMELKADGRLYVQGVYDFTASASTVVVQPNGLVARTSSSIKYKTNVETIQDQYSDAILNVRPVWYQSLSELDNPDWGWWGFIAEEVAEIDPRLVHWRTVESVVQEDGSRVETPCDPVPEDVAYDRFVPHLLNLIKRQQQAIEILEAKVAALETP